MRWKRLVCGKISRARITAKAWLLEPGRRLALVDDLVAVVGATAVIIRWRVVPIAAVRFSRSC